MVRYLPKPGSWIGVLTQIQNNENTKIHGHSGDVYEIKDPYSSTRIVTNKKNIQDLGMNLSDYELYKERKLKIEKLIWEM